VNGQPGDRPIEVLLEDGGHVIVTFTDRASRTEAADAIAELLVLAAGSESDIEEAICAEAADLGLVTSSSPSRHPTVVLLGGSLREVRAAHQE
jgi:hypothetical protein